MWCSTCQQDVPGLGSPSGGELRCGKCGESLLAGEPVQAAVSESKCTAPIAPANAGEKPAVDKLLQCPPWPEDDWALEAELRGVQRLISSLKSSPAAVTEPLELHLAEPTLPGWHAGLNAAMPEYEEMAADQDSVERPRTNSAAWTILSLSLAVFACGAVLLGWSLLGQRDDLWPVGLPLALIGQAGLVLGVVLQLEGFMARATAGPRTTPSGMRSMRRGRRRLAAGADKAAD